MGISGRGGLEAICLHCAGGIDQGEEGEDDVFGERRPSIAKTCEARVDERQSVPIGDGVSLLRRCKARGGSKDSVNPSLVLASP